MRQAYLGAVRIEEARLRYSDVRVVVKVCVRDDGIRDIASIRVEGGLECARACLSIVYLGGSGPGR